MKKRARSSARQVAKRTKLVRRKATQPRITSALDRHFESIPALSFEELVKAQGVKPLDDPSILAGVWPEDDDIDEFLEEVYRSRRI